ncbi:MAG: hypothetical protein AAF543_05155 [Pseudomonadota bacterium]
MASAEDIQTEIDKNYEAFKKRLPDLAKRHPGKFALMRKEDIVQIFDSAGDARLYAEAQYKDGLWSIQQISDHILDLGFFSHAVHVPSIQSVQWADN